MFSLNELNTNLSSSGNELLIVFLLAMLPITELRLSIPYGILYLGLTPISALVVSLVGNFIISLPLIYIFNYIKSYTENHPSFSFIHRFLYRYSTKKYRKYNYLKRYGLILFVGIPFPGTGAWSGSLVASFLGLGKSYSRGCIFAGLVISSVATTLLTVYGHLMWLSIK
tara:strand:+ start:428 stop:934 length:507 start_codon:yes stop_codon:yes gene_type:complete